MKFTLCQTVLKDGTTVIIREASLEDAREMRRVAKEFMEESEFIPCEKGEFQLSLQEEESWIKGFTDSPNSLLLVAEIAGHIVGNISLTGNTRKQLQHTAVVGIGMLRKVRGKGIGSLFFESALQWVKSNPILEILMLEVHATNIAGIHLYQKYGFEKAGFLPENIKIDESEYVDTIIMRNKIK